MNASPTLTHKLPLEQLAQRYPAHTPRLNGAADKPPSLAPQLSSQPANSTAPLPEPTPIRKSVPPPAAPPKRERRQHDKEFVEAVIAAAKVPGMSQHDVARQFDIPPSLVSRWASEGVPRMTLKRAAREQKQALQLAKQAAAAAKTLTRRPQLGASVAMASPMAGLDDVFVLLQQALELQTQAMARLDEMRQALRVVFGGSR